MAERLEERLASEVGPHFVLDQGASEIDEMEDRLVPAGLIFVLAVLLGLGVRVA